MANPSGAAGIRSAGHPALFMFLRSVEGRKARAKGGDETEHASLMWTLMSQSLPAIGLKKGVKLSTPPLIVWGGYPHPVLGETGYSECLGQQEDRIMPAHAT
jgi:hypothetical protein